LPLRWLRPCLESVRRWACANGYEYRFVGDELFDPVAPDLLEKTASQKVIATDLARLKWIQSSLADGYECVVWCDADFLIFEPQRFALPGTAYALGREVWVQRNDDGKLRFYKKVHNAFLMFRQDNHFLDFYADTAERLLHLNRGHMPPQFIGPKLLTALHNIAICPVLENAAMLSPLVMRDLLTGDGEAVDLFRDKSQELPAGVNLSGSLTAAEGLNDVDMETLIAMLQGKGI
jgi:hypothetical protein